MWKRVPSLCSVASRCGKAGSETRLQSGDDLDRLEVRDEDARGRHPPLHCGRVARGKADVSVDEEGDADKPGAHLCVSAWREGAHGLGVSARDGGQRTASSNAKPDRELEGRLSPARAAPRATRSGCISPAKSRRRASCRRMRRTSRAAGRCTCGCCCRLRHHLLRRRRFGTSEPGRHQRRSRTRSRWRPAAAAAAEIGR